MMVPMRGGAPLVAESGLANHLSAQGSGLRARQTKGIIPRKSLNQKKCR